MIPTLIWTFWNVINVDMTFPIFPRVFSWGNEVLKIGIEHSSAIIQLFFFSATSVNKSQCFKLRKEEMNRKEEFIQNIE